MTGVQRCAFCFQAEDGIRDSSVTGVQTCALFISSRRRHTRFKCDWSSDVCSSDLGRNFAELALDAGAREHMQRLALRAARRAGLARDNIVDDEDRKSVV